MGKRNQLDDILFIAGSHDYFYDIPKRPETPLQPTQFVKGLFWNLREILSAVSEKSIFVHLQVLIGSDHGYILRSMHGESEPPRW